MKFSEGLKYPWGKPKRLWNVLWILIPILGIFAIMGYGKKIVNSIVKGNKKELPQFGSFGENLGIGFMLFLKVIPILIVLMIVNFIPVIGQIIYLIIAIFFLPWLMINLMQKYTIASTFEFDKAANIVFNNFVEYLVILVKSVVYAAIYGILSIVLVGIPCSIFGKYIYLADFYRKYSRTPAKKPIKKIGKSVKAKKK